MNKTVWQTTLRDFLSQAASASPTPGGGSVAAVCGALGLALVAMGLEISAPASGSMPENERLLAQTRRLLEQLRASADEDVRVFESYMQALKLPKSSDEERRARQEAVGQAAVQATQVPLHTAEDLLQALRCAVEAACVVKAQILSDVEAGADLLWGATAAVLRNVDINLPSIRDPELAAAFRERRLALEAEATTAHGRVSQAAAQRRKGR